MSNRKRESEVQTNADFIDGLRNSFTNMADEFKELGKDPEQAAPHIDALPLMGSFIIPRFQSGNDYRVNVVLHHSYCRELGSICYLERQFWFTNLSLMNKRIVCHEFMHSLLHSKFRHICYSDVSIPYESLCDMGIELIELNRMYLAFDSALKLWLDQPLNFKIVSNVSTKSKS